MVLEKNHVDHWLAHEQFDPDQYLFHYTGVDSLGPILTHGTLQMSTLDGMNDPREQKPWRAHNLVLPAGEEERDVDLALLIDQERVQSEPDRLLRQAARVACFTKERPAREDAGSGTLFHRGWARARMWHTYAREHTGVCLAFDKEALGSAIADARPPADGEITAFHEIHYRDHALDIPLKGSFETVEEIGEALAGLLGAPSNGTAQAMRDTLQNLLFTKNTDWASEDEVRALVLLSPGEMNDIQAEKTDPGPLYVPYRDALRAIVLGENCDPPLSAVAAAEEKRGITEDNIVRATWVSGEPILQPSRTHRIHMAGTLRPGSPSR